MSFTVRPGDVGLMPADVRRSVSTLYRHLPEEWVTDDRPLGVQIHRFSEGTVVELTHADLEGYQQTVFDRSGRAISFMQIEQSSWMEWYCGAGGTPASTADELDVAECISALPSIVPQRGVETRYREGFWTTEDDLDARAVRDAVVVDPGTPLDLAGLVAAAMQKYVEAERPYGRVDFQVTWWLDPAWGQVAARVALSAPDAQTVTYEAVGGGYDTMLYTATTDGAPTRLLCERR
jgi:hypothetical protein